MTERKFVIRLNGLPVGSHLYEFKVDSAFFDIRDYSDIKEAKVNVEINLLKQNHVMSLTFNINGILSVLCDRCAKPYDVEIESREKMQLRFGDPNEPHAEDVFVLPHGENELDISQALFEFITLAIPSRLVPCEEDETFKCNNETLKKLSNISIDGVEPKPETSIWDKLKNINNN